MKRTFYFYLLIGVVWLLNSSTAHGRERSGLLLSAAAQDSHQMNMGDKKNGDGFQHVHALAMDADGRTLFLGAHTGLFRSDDGGHSWKKAVLSAKQSNFDIMAVTPDPKEPKTIYATMWDYRRQAYQKLAQRLGGIAQESYSRVFAVEPQLTAK